MYYFQLTKKQILLSLLWLTVVLIMIFSDFFSTTIELNTTTTIKLPINAITAMIIAAIPTTSTLLMVLVSWLLPYYVNRWVQLIIASLTILYIIGGRVTLPHYFIMGSIEVCILIAILIIAYRWKYNHLSDMVL